MYWISLLFDCVLDWLLEYMPSDSSSVIGSKLDITDMTDLEQVHNA